MSSVDKCEGCDIDLDFQVTMVCPECGHDHSTNVSDHEDKMEALLVRASIPNLASLFQAGKKKGLIKPTQDYGHKT